MSNFLISAFGILIADRILYRLEIFNYISSENRKKFLILTLLISIIFSIFKDLIVLNIILFGIFLIFLIFFYVFHEKKLENLFENKHKALVDELIILIQSGCSPIKAINEAFSSFNDYEKKLFLPLKAVTEQNFEVSAQNGFHFKQFYFVELIEILKQKARVIDQLETFRNSLQIQIKMRRKSRTVTASVRAQAIVAVFIYGIFLWISLSQFNLLRFPIVLGVSVVLFCIGLIWIFKLGRRIKWTV